MLLMMFASFGRFGDDAALLVPVPYLVMLPVLFVVRVKSGTTTAAVWQNFNCFLPALTYVFCLAWPLALFRRDFLDKTQCALAWTGVLLLLVASRAAVCVIDSHVTKARDTGSFMF